MTEGDTTPACSAARLAISSTNWSSGSSFLHLRTWAHRREALMSHSDQQDERSITNTTSSSSSFSNWFTIIIVCICIVNDNHRITIKMTLNGNAHYRLNGSSSPVLTATCLSYGSLCDFLTYFSSTDLEVTPIDRFWRKMAQTTWVRARTCHLE